MLDKCRGTVYSDSNKNYAPTMIHIPRNYSKPTPVPNRAAQDTYVLIVFLPRTNTLYKSTTKLFLQGHVTRNM